jgi:hypothetical protein
MDACDVDRWIAPFDMSDEERERKGEGTTG